ncbi:hypothetical protein [Sphingomonas sp. ERG5]|uniref:hypothetical protein n=1 Tax=Sphingomonas sp. ERG5 TaxID=1381597 RepID=UPI00054BABA4
MGERTVAQEALFYSFNLERHVPADHLLRSIDRFVDLSDIRSSVSGARLLMFGTHRLVFAHVEP